MTMVLRLFRDFSWQPGSSCIPHLEAKRSSATSTAKGASTTWPTIPSSILSCTKIPSTYGSTPRWDGGAFAYSDERFFVCFLYHTATRS